MTDTAQQHYNELSFYTLSLGDDAFIHQHIIDAYTAQTADEHTKPISIVFALAGLFLFIEKNYTGKQVQYCHMLMAKHKRPWPAIVLPAKREEINVSDVLAALPGPERNGMIHQWCASVWQAYRHNREIIKGLVASIPEL